MNHLISGFVVNFKFVSFLVFVLNVSFLVFSVNSENISHSSYQQWFMGPILTPNATTVPPNHPALELEAIISKSYGYYDSRGRLKHDPSIWGIGPLFDFQMGLNRVLGVELIGAMVTNFSSGGTFTYLTDTIFRFGIQVSTENKKSWVPDFRILLQETFPTGNYQKLNPKKNGADCTGQGSYQTGAHLAIQKTFHSHRKHPFRFRGSIGYFIPSAVTIKGLNYYGGDSKTRGIIYPGNYWISFFYGEYALSRRWAIGCESNYITTNKGEFKKKKGAKISVPLNNQFSIFPQIQHTYTENIGIIVGTWITLSGKNSEAFAKLYGTVLFLF